MTQLFILVLSLTCCVSLHAADTASANLYWPGDFEHGIYGGMYSNKVNVKISTKQNHSQNGRSSWELNKGYQHLELLVSGHRSYSLSFWALSNHQQTPPEGYFRLHRRHSGTIRAVDPTIRRGVILEWDEP